MIQDENLKIRKKATEVSKQIEEDRVTVSYLILLLKDPDDYVKGIAAKALGQMGEAAQVAIPHLIPLLNDGNHSAFSHVQENAAEALGQMGEAAQVAIPHLIPLLNSKYPDVKGSAAKALGQMGEAAQVAIPHLIPLLTYDGTQVSIAISAAFALSLMEKGSQTAIAHFIARLKDSNWFLRTSAAKALGQMGEAAQVAIPHLIPLLHDSNIHVRASAAKALGQMGEVAQVAIPHIIPLLHDSDEGEQEAKKYVRASAAEALGKMGEAAQVAIPHLIPILHDSDYSFRVNAVTALEKIGKVAPEVVIPHLLHILKDSRKYLSANMAIWMLGKIGKTAPEVVIPHLIPLLKDSVKASDYSLKQDAALALGKMGEAAPEVVIPHLIPLLKDSDWMFRGQGALALGEMGEAAPEVVIPHLIPLLKDSNRFVRESAARALKNIGEAAQVAIPHLIPLLKDSDRDVKFHTIRALGQIGKATPQVVIPHLLPFLKCSGFMGDHEKAIEALGDIGQVAPQVVILHILPLLQNSDIHVRQNAVQVLAEVGEAARPTISHILPLLQDSDVYVRRYSAKALGQISKAKTATNSQTTLLAEDTEKTNIEALSDTECAIKNNKKATIPPSTANGNGIHLGIDFGTTFSSAALLLNGEIKRVKEPVKLGYSFPSSIFVDKQGKVFVGQVAENQRFQDPSSYIQEFKKELGKTMSSTWETRKFLPEDLVSEMFKVLKQEAEKMVNQPIDGVIATIPASYAGYRAELMEKAARDAGFKQVQLLPEPVAAAIYYDHPSSGGKPLAEGEVLLVYDLGGGTFDAALLQKRGIAYQMLAQPVGDENLGGSNFDWAMYQDLQTQCSEDLKPFLNPRAKEERAMKIRLRVKDWLREFKHQLSSVEQHTDDLPIGDFESYTLTRQRFEEMIHPQLQTTCGLCNQLVVSAGLRWDQVSKILLVGGSCRIPYVQRLLYDRFKRPVEWVDELELAVCLGAAIYREVEQNKG